MKKVECIRMTELPCWKKRTDATPKKYGRAVFDLTLIENEKAREQLAAYLAWYCFREDISIRTVYDLSMLYRKMALFLNACCADGKKISPEEEDDMTRRMEKWLVSRGEPVAVVRHSGAMDLDVRKKHSLICFFHAICRYLSEESDTPEKQKDIWQLDKLGLSLRQYPARPIRTFNFTKIRQKALREECKKIIFEELKIKSVSYCCTMIRILARLSRFLENKKKEEDSFYSFSRGLIEEYLIYLKTEDGNLSDYRREISSLRSLFSEAAYYLELPFLGELFLPTDRAKSRKLLFHDFSDAELARINEAVLTMDEQIARALFIQEFLGLRISDTLLLCQDCLKKRSGRWIITIGQQKTGHGYTKTVREEDALLIRSAIAYTQERFGKRKYIFVREDAPDLPMTYSRISYHLQKAFRENDVCTDEGEPLRCPTHLFRHTYGRKLTDLHVDDYVIAGLLGHRGTRSVQNYRKMSDHQMAEEIRPVLDSIDEMIRRSRVKWRKNK